MANTTYGAIKLATANDVGTVLKKKMGSQTGFAPKDWADTINLMGLLPIIAASGSIAHFEDGADDVPLKSLTAQILPIQEGTGDPSPSNHRPIIGTSVLNVTGTGKNLFNKNNVTFETGNIQSDGTIGTVAEYYHTDTYIRVKAETEYCFSGTFVDGSRRNAVAFYDVNKTFLSIYLPSNNQPAKFTTPANTYYIRFNVSTGYNVNDMQIEQGSTATTYESYRGSTYTIALGRTVYVATYNSETGVLTVTHVLQKMDELNWSRNGTTITFYSEILTGYLGQTDDFACSCYLPSVNGGYNASNLKVSLRDSGTQIRIWVADNSYETSQDFKSSLTNQTITLPLAEPIEIQLEPTEMSTLLGVNNFYHDGNGDSAVEYRADIDILINELGG